MTKRFCQLNYSLFYNLLYIYSHALLYIISIVFAGASMSRFHEVLLASQSQIVEESSIRKENQNP